MSDFSMSDSSIEETIAYSSHVMSDSSIEETIAYSSHVLLHV